MKERLTELRAYLGLTGEKFGEKIGLKKVVISQMETGKSCITDRTVSLICREFNVNETWLRTGDGDMFEPISEKELREKLLNEHSNPSQDPARAAFIKAIVDLTDSELDTVLKFMENTLKEYKKNTEG